MVIEEFRKHFIFSKLPHSKMTFIYFIFFYLFLVDNFYGNAMNTSSWFPKEKPFFPSIKNVGVVTLVTGMLDRSPSINKCIGSVTLIKDNGYFIVVDSPSATDMISKEKMLSSLALQNTSSTEVQMVITTHGHPDHFGQGLLFSNARHFFATYEYTDNTYVTTDLSTNDSMKLTHHVEVWNTPGHTNQDISLIVRTSCCGTVAVVGDLFYDENDANGNIKNWIDDAWNPKLGMINRRKVICNSNRIVPGHGPMFKVTDDMKKLYNCSKCTKCAIINVRCKVCKPIIERTITTTTESPTTTTTTTTTESPTTTTTTTTTTTESPTTTTTTTTTESPTTTTTTTTTESPTTTTTTTTESPTTTTTTTTTESPTTTTITTTTKPPTTTETTTTTLTSTTIISSTTTETTTSTSTTTTTIPLCFDGPQLQYYVFTHPCLPCPTCPVYYPRKNGKVGFNFGEFAAKYNPMNKVGNSEKKEGLTSNNLSKFNYQNVNTYTSSPQKYIQQPIIYPELKSYPLLAPFSKLSKGEVDSKEKGIESVPSITINSSNIPPPIKDVASNFVNYFRSHVTKQKSVEDAAKSIVNDALNVIKVNQFDNLLSQQLSLLPGVNGIQSRKGE